MFHHLVLVGFARPLSAADRGFMVGQCERLRRDIPGLLEMQFVDNASPRSPEFTHAFVTTFVDEASHDRYQEAPGHERLRRKVSTLKQHLAVLDYHA